MIFVTHSVLGLNERVVDSDDVDLVMLNTIKKRTDQREKPSSAPVPADERRATASVQTNVRITEDNTANAAETVDTNFDGHGLCMIVLMRQVISKRLGRMEKNDDSEGLRRTGGGVQNHR